MLVCKKDTYIYLPSLSGNSSVPSTSYSHLPEAPALSLCLESGLQSWHSCFPLSSFRGNITSAETFPDHSEKLPSLLPNTQMGTPSHCPFLSQPFVYFRGLITIHNYVTYFLLSCFQTVPPRTCLLVLRRQGSHLVLSFVTSIYLSASSQHT